MIANTATGLIRVDKLAMSPTESLSAVNPRQGGSHIAPEEVEDTLGKLKESQ